MTPADSNVPRPFSRAEWLTLALIALLYCLLLGHYRTFNIDNPWFANFAYAWRHGHNPVDPLMLRRFPHGMGGVEAFGKLAAILQDVVMDATGWQLMHFEVLSTVVVLGTLVVLADVTRRMGRSPYFVICYLTVMAATEPFVATAEQARYEYLSVLLLAMGMGCGVRGWTFAGAFLAALCMEVQPAGCVAFLGVAAFLLLWDRDKTAMWPRLLQIALGLLAAGGVYLLLHPYIFNTFRHAQWSQARDHAKLPGGFVVGYFADSKRHLVDLAAIVAAFVATVRSRRNLLKQWPAVALMLGMVASAAMGWDNARYFTLLMPFLAWFVVEAFFSASRWRWIVAATLAFTLPQYAYRAYISIQRAPDLTAAEQRQIADALTRVAVSLGKQPQNLNVVGNLYTWFAHPDHFVALDLRTLALQQALQADVVLCFDHKLDPVLKENSSEVICSELAALPPTGETLDLNGRLLRVIPMGTTPVRYQMPAWLLKRRQASN